MSDAQISLIWRRINFPEHLNDPEHNQAHYQRVHGHRQGKTSNEQCVTVTPDTPGSTVNHASYGIHGNTWYYP